jgi:DnaK suppressor protein
MAAKKKPAPKPSKVKKPVPAKSTAAKPAAKKSPEPAPKAVAKKPAAKPESIKEPIVKSSAAKPPVVAKAPAAKAVATAATDPVVATARRSNPRPVAVDPDDNDGNDTLLSGPRNVQPYVPKRGEQYMSPTQLEHFRDILQSWKQDLMMEVDRTVSHMKDEAANFPDPNDRATQEEEFSLELRTRDRERKLIRKIDEALARIEDGSYGYCLETGEQIGVKRLEARPVATLSIEAQERRERREKQYGDRDDRYR